MEKLEAYLDSINNTVILKSLLDDYEKLGYSDEIIYKHHLNFLLENCYNIRIKENHKIRMGQKKFRKLILKKFNYKCLVSQNDCLDELEAAHIVPVHDEESYDIDNGLLLTKTLHGTMEKLLWAINPKTLIIEVKPNYNVGQIKQYAGNKVNLILNKDLEDNLTIQYNKFINSFQKN
jgi:hypothetical protein